MEELFKSLYAALCESQFWTYFIDAYDKNTFKYILPLNKFIRKANLDLCAALDFTDNIPN